MKIAIMNQKGGVTKTETSKTLAKELAQENTVTLVDADPQANNTKFFKAHNGKSMLDVILGESVLEDVIHKVNDKLSIINSSNNLAALDIEISNKFGAETQLMKTLERITKSAEVTIFDCPPAFNRLTASIIAVSDYIIVPIIPAKDAIDGYQAILKNIVDIMDIMGIKKKTIKILVARYNEHRIADKENLEKILNLKHPMFNTCIRESTAVNKANNQHQTILEYDKSNNVAKDYISFIAEVRADMKEATR